MKLQKIIKWIISGILSIGILPGVLALLYYIYFRLDVNGSFLLKYIPYTFLDWAGSHLDTVSTPLHINAVYLIFILIGVVILCAITIVVIPLYILSIFNKLRVSFTIYRKNLGFELGFEKQSGTEWKVLLDKKRKEEEQKEEEEQKKKAEKKTQEQYTEQQYYRNHQQQEQANSTKKVEEISDLDKARLLFMFDDLNFTEAELKRVRNGLIKSFHQDGSNNEEADKVHSQKINAAYKLLLPYAKK